jgi:CheY-like chemotaxis protein
MSRKRYPPKQIIGKPREAEVPLAQGQMSAEVMEQEFKILLLEAVECSAEMVEYELSKASTRFTLARVKNQESYLQALKEFCPQLILADCRLPHTDCLVALALAQDICPEVPFLFLSGDLSPATSRARQKVISFMAVAGQEPKIC